MSAESRATVTHWPAPAKLNLFLHVTGRRADGYHTLQTAFQLVDLCDTLEIEPTDDGRIERLAGPSGVAPDDDLAVRAARRLQAESGTARGARLTLRKRIPLGGGLGGGSSDAATALVALNHLWGTGFDLSRLAAIGVEIGADVPVFVMGRSAWGEGIGERLKTLPPQPAKWFVIIHPGIAVPTAEVFQAPELTRNSPLLTIRGLFGPEMRNDCEPVVRARYPAVGDALDWLGRFGGARMTGTGSCVFAAFDRSADAERIAARVPDVWRSFVARGLDESPLHAQLR
jgi:4-diphosphocytidyl-2-C-methyl-D-erythritol kinase